MSGVDGRSQLVEDTLADHQMREGVAHAVARGHARRRLLELQHVLAILLERYRREADVVVRFEEQRRPLASRVRYAVPVGRPTHHRAARDLHLTLCLEKVDSRLDDRKVQPQAPGQFAATELTRKVQRLQRELDQEVQTQAGLFMCGRGDRHVRDSART